MSNHVSQKAINLHHAQVDNAQARRGARRAQRVKAYRDQKKGHILQQHFAMFSDFTCFAYTEFATAYYLYYVLKLTNVV